MCTKYVMEHNSLNLGNNKTQDHICDIYSNPWKSSITINSLLQINY